jgi:hypothetical protein
MDIYSILSGLANAYRDPEQGILSQDQLNAQLSATPLAQAMQTQAPQPQAPQVAKAKALQKAKAKGAAFNPATDAGAYAGFDNPDNYGDGQQVFNPATDAGAYAGFDNPDNYGNGQAPQTPLSQAMDPQAPSVQPMQAAAPQQAPGFLDRLNSRADSNSIYDGLIKGGAAMMGAKNLQQGLAEGVSGFNDAYDARTDKDKAENTPKVTQLADGAFSSVQYPGKPPVIMKNSEVAGYLDEQKKASAEVMANKLILNANLQNQGRIATENRATAKDATNKLAGIDATIAKFEDAKGAVDRYGRGGQAAGLIPGGNLVAGVVSPETAVDNQRLQELNVKEVLSAGADLKGATSDKDMLFLAKAAPGPGASPEVLKDWHARTLEAMKNVRAKLQAQIERGDNGGMPQGSQSSPQQPSQRPAASSGGVQNVDAVTAEMRRRGLLK